jgi:hypothetical protein
MKRYLRIPRAFQSLGRAIPTYSRGAIRNIAQRRERTSVKSYPNRTELDGGDEATRIAAAL